MTWSVAIILICVVFCILQIAMTRSHRRNLEEHEKRMNEIYKRYRR